MRGRWDEFEASLEHLRRRAGIAGLVAGLNLEGETVWSAAFGTASPGRPCTVDTRFEIASLTKPVVSIALLRLVEDGALDVDEPVAPFVPASSPFAAALAEGPVVTIGHVWSHTSGLRLIPRGRRGRLFSPGAAFRYNGAAFGLLTHVVEQRAGAPIADVVEPILRKARMQDSAASPSGLARVTDYWRRPSRLARALGRDRRRRPVGRPRVWERLLGLRPGPLNAAAGLVSTVPDLLRLDACIDDGTVMTDAAKELAWTPTVLTDGSASPYGKGWFTGSWAGERTAWHTGLRNGINSALWVRVLSRRRTFIVLANSAGISNAKGLRHGDLAAAPVAEIVQPILIDPD